MPKLLEDLLEDGELQSLEALKTLTKEAATGLPIRYASGKVDDGQRGTMIWWVTRSARPCTGLAASVACLAVCLHVLRSRSALVDKVETHCRSYAERKVERVHLAFIMLFP
jgi:hypothetical protein